jgi:hypothetical protein
MSRGTTSNRAYLTVRGEETAADVFARCLTSDWIDQPAHTRQAQLRDEPPHRAGLLDGPVLRGLLEQRHQLTSEVERAEAHLRFLPAEMRRTETERAAAERTVADLEARRQTADAVIVDYDRPLRRRRHDQELQAARQELADIPGPLDRATSTLTAAEETLSALHTNAGKVRSLLAGRSDIDAKIADVDDRLDQDLRVRTRVTRREQPDNVTAVLGPRSRQGHDARQWDAAAGRLAQHQAAFDLTDGLGPQPHYDDRSTYAYSHDHVTQLVGPLQRLTIDRTVELPDLGLSL